MSYYDLTPEEDQEEALGFDEDDTSSSLAEARRVRRNRSDDYPYF